MITSFCSKVIQETVYQILSESPEFYRRYYQKNILVSFSGHTSCILFPGRRCADCKVERVMVKNDSGKIEDLPSPDSYRRWPNVIEALVRRTC